MCTFTIMPKAAPGQSVWTIQKYYLSPQRCSTCHGAGLAFSEIAQIILCPICSGIEISPVKWKVCRDPIYIEHLEIIVYESQTPTIEYYDSYDNYYNENEIFLTPESAQAECDIRNI